MIDHSMGDGAYFRKESAFFTLLMYYSSKSRNIFVSKHNKTRAQKYSFFYSFPVQNLNYENCTGEQTVSKHNACSAMDMKDFIQKLT